MEYEVPRHEKIRFRREEITSLKAFPSAAGQDHLLSGASLPVRFLKGCGVGIAILGTLLFLGVLAVVAAGMSGIGTDRLRQEAEAAIERFAGVDVAATVGDAQISLDSSRFIAIEVKDVRLQAADGGGDMVDAGIVRFGVRFWPLMSGSLRLGSATISNARIVAGALPSEGGPDWKAALTNEDGLIDPDRVAKAVFDGMHRAFDTMQTGSTRHLELDNVEIVLPEGGRMRVVRIVSALLDQATDGELDFSAKADIDGRIVSIEGTAERDTVSHRLTGLDLKLVAPAGAENTAEAGTALGNTIGPLELSLTGQEGIGGEPSRLEAKFALKQSSLDLGERGLIAGDVDVAAALVSGTGKIEIQNLRLASGRSLFSFHGALGPVPKGGETQGGATYRYELVSDGSTLAPSDSPEPGLKLLARVSGHYDPLANRLTAEQFGVRTGPGELLGTATLEFAEDKAPGIFLAMTVPTMPVSHVKQLWPWFAAGGARKWVLANLYGGRVTRSSLQYRVPVGRMGNGIPLSHDEVFGTFNVEEARFDMTGSIPPMRDAFGSVDFRGNDIDIALSSGTVFMPSGRTVAASNGKLLVREANRRPVIGDLDIDVAGDAQAVTELASYEPINAMRHIGLAPEDFSGDVEGHVKADVPLQLGIDTDSLGWLVTMNYSDLSVAKPFDGQMVTQAEGTITVEPHKAVIAATARLNGAPAEIALVEPLGEGGPARQRNIEVTLDDKARAAMVPGLDGLLSGPVKVDFKSGEGQTQEIVADLTGARLDIPWAGWSKGPGVAAEVKFSLQNSGRSTELSNFRLTGKSFAIGGDITLADGELSSARFDTAQLNRGDDISLNIKRSGQGYAVDIKGNALDARAMIKQFTADADTAAQSTDSVPVTVNADIGSLAGFHGEQLANVKLAYKGNGGKTLDLTVAGSTKSGARISVQNGTTGGRSKMEMQSTDAGAVLRFMDIYEHVEGGTIRLALSGDADGVLKGQVDTTDFWVVDEPKLASIVSTAPSGDNRSLNQAVKADIDTSRVKFERGFAAIEKGGGHLSLERGVLRGPLIGSTFQGTLYDARGRMAMTGTFMPAYGLNRIFGELPLVGMILGNGRDRGLIGVTFRLTGNAKSPQLQINPLSVIAPGIFRSIFEFR